MEEKWGKLQSIRIELDPDPSVGPKLFVGGEEVTVLSLNIGYSQRSKMSLKAEIETHPKDLEVTVIEGYMMPDRIYQRIKAQDKDKEA